jgi:tetratricopeptide (TPR) repeat protein
MRSDFIGDCARFQGLPEVVSGAQFLVPSLSRDQREEAIRKPVELSGAKIDSELVERLLNDSSEELDQLPVLQHCLARLWMRAGSAEVSVEPAPAAENATAEPEAVPIRHLTEKVYRDIDGITGALSAHADEILKSLAGKENAAEQTFRALAEIDKDGRAVRRARPLSQLIAETGASREDICAVLDEFRADDCSFIVPPLSRAPTSQLPDDTVVDVGHEALLRRWVRVRGDPDATGQRADKRDIGWLRQEQRDGDRYQFLRSCVDPESLNETRLSDDQVRRYWNWWDNWKPNPTWAERYGGKFDEVERLVNESYAASRKSRWWKRGAYAAAVAVVALVGLGGLYLIDQQRQAERMFKLAVSSAKDFSQTILDTFNSGQVATSGAVELNKVAARVYEEAKKLKLRETSETSMLQTAWLLTDVDLDEAVGGNKEKLRARIKQAEDNARKYLARQPDDRGWQGLLHGSLFRLGDIDLDQYIHSREPRLLDQASAEYLESEAIAGKLLASDTALPKYETADPDAFASQRFYLAFSINKVGELMQVQGNLKGALGKYQEALEQALLIERASRMEWKLQSATTRIKIASALIAQTPKDFDGALRNYSDAIEREEALYADNKSNNIVRSNLAAAYEGRGQVFEQSTKFDKAFENYAEAVKLFSRLVDDDARDSKWLDRLARVHRRFGLALEAYARSRNEPLDKAAEQYKGEVAAREKLAEKDPTDPASQTFLHDSRARLRRAVTSGEPGNPPASE